MSTNLILLTHLPMIVMLIVVTIIIIAVFKKDVDRLSFPEKNIEL